MQGNPIRDRMAAGEVVIGPFLSIASPLLVEIIALADFDFVILDGEHGPLSADLIYPMILAAEARGISAFARVGELDKQVILKYLDVGVTGIMAPQIADAQQAQTAIAATRFSPRGNRGLAGGRIFDFALRQPAPDLVQPLSDRVLTMIQFEHVDTLAHLDEILDTPELDVLFVGPNDLAQSLGLPGQPGHPRVTEVADEVVARCKAKGIKTGTTISDVATAKATADRGFDMLVPNLPSLIAQASRSLVQGIRAAL